MREKCSRTLRRILALFLALLLLGGVLPAKTSYADPEYRWAEIPEISAETALLMDQTTGTVIFEKDAKRRMYPASLTKILTALIVLENCSLSEEVTFSHDAIANTYGSSAGMKEGEVVTVEQCLYILLLVSANEAGYALAEHVCGPGKIDEFSQMMNDYAAGLGCVNSHFHNPHGLPDTLHWTCAYDLALISRKAMQNEIFRKITYAQYYILPPTNLSEEERFLSNHHQMRYGYRLPKYKYEYCIGGKTGYTDDAGYTLATFGKKDGVELVCIVMGAGSPYKDEENQYTDTIKLFETCWKNCKLVDMLSSDAVRANHLPTFGKYNALFNTWETTLSVEGPGKILLPNDATKDQVVTELVPAENAENPQPGDVIGEIRYSLGGREVGSARILYTPSESSGLIPASVDIETTTRGSEESAGQIERETWHLPEVHIQWTPELKVILAAAGLLLLLIALFVLYHKLYLEPQRHDISRRVGHPQTTAHAPDRRSSKKHRSRN